MKWSKKMLDLDGPLVLYQVEIKSGDSVRIETSLGMCDEQGDMIDIEKNWSGWTRNEVFRWVPLDGVLTLLDE